VGDRFAELKELADVVFVSRLLTIVSTPIHCIYTLLFVGELSKLDVLNLL